MNTSAHMSLDTEHGFEYPVYGYEISPRGHMRPSALARFAQQAAADELQGLVDRGLAAPNRSWVVRRNVVRGWRRVPRTSSLRFVRRIIGSGTCWLQAHTEVFHGEVPIGASVQAFWVQLDDASRRPVPIDPIFETLCRESGGDVDLMWRREVRGELAGLSQYVVPLREADYDALGHVNNAVMMDLVADLLPEADEIVVEYDVSIDWGTASVVLEHGTRADGATGFRLLTHGGCRLASGLLCPPGTAAVSTPTHDGGGPPLVPGAR